MPYLIISQGDSQQRLDLTAGQPLVVGRSRDCDLHLDDPSLSRRHCEFFASAGVWKLRDLGSFNGTWCNDGAITDHTLQHGDRVHLGLTDLIFTLTPAEQKGQAGPTAASADAQALARKLRNFEALLEITKAVSGELAQESLLTLVVRKAIDLTRAERGFLVLVEQGNHVFRVALQANGQPVADPERTVSKSVLANVVQTGEPVLTIDAQHDLQNLSQTIAGLEVRSLMCAPLRIKGDVLGCVYVDSQIAEQAFGDESLDLLQAFADQASIALHNARLYEEVKASREQEKRVRQLFQRYVPADVVRRALEMSDHTKMSTKQVATVLFSDIRSFTSISERMEPEEVVSFLNDYLQRMVDVVVDEGGIVDKFIGDAVMAVFGAPFPRPDDAVRAVRAAHRMIAELDKYNQDQAKLSQVPGGRQGVPIRIGIGIHTGPLIAGNIGSDKKMEYTVIGDTVNIASRMQDLTKEYGVEIIITQAVWDATRRRVPIRALGSSHIKGKELPMQLFEAVRLAPGQNTQQVPVVFAGATGAHPVPVEGTDPRVAYRPAPPPSRWHAGAQPPPPGAMTSPATANPLLGAGPVRRVTPAGIRSMDDELPLPPPPTATPGESADALDGSTLPRRPLPRPRS